MLSYRAATMLDDQRLFEWRNDPLTRAMFKTSAPILWSEHIKWLTERLARLRPSLYIFEVDGKPVGTFRFDDDGMSYTIDPKLREQGYGTEMLSFVRKVFGVKRAEIYRRNLASIKAAKRSGHTIVLLD